MIRLYKSFALLAFIFLSKLLNAHKNGMFQFIVQLFYNNKELLFPEVNTTTSSKFILQIESDKNNNFKINLIYSHVYNIYFRNATASKFILIFK